MRMQKRMDNSGWQADGWAWANDMRYAQLPPNGCRPRRDNNWCHPSSRY
jgi:hypothetical protein